jgi:hypothetical protein
MNGKIIPNSYNGWDPLKQVILGNCYTPDFFNDVKDLKLRHLLQKILWETQEDLKSFKKSLEDAGVEVLQVPSNISCANINNPTENVNQLFEDRKDAWYGWLNTRGGIPKPWIAPRDRLITYGDKLSVTGTDFGIIKFLSDNWVDKKYLDTQLADSFLEAQKNSHIKKLGPLKPSKYMFDDRNFNWNNCNTPGTFEYEQYKNMTWGYQAPSVTRVGDVLVVDQIEVNNLGEYITSTYPEFKQTHHAMGGHNDGVFCPIRPGHIVTTDEKTNYSDTFPGWDVHVIRNPSQAVNISDFNNIRKTVNGKWWTPESKNNSHYVEFINSWLHEWVGEVEETVFEVNMLVINPELIFCTNYNKGVFDYFEKIGVTPHIVPFRHRFFWDSGLHCLTLDTVREGGMQNYF